MTRAWTLLLCLAACSTGGDSPVLTTADGPPEAVLATAVEPVEARDTRRLIPLGGGLTEIVYALGHGEQVVATDVSSHYPQSASEKATLGYYRRLQAEGVLAQRPSLILATEGSGPPAAIEQVRAAGVEVVEIPAAETLDAARDRIRAVAELLGSEGKGQRLIAALDADLDQVATLTDGRARPKVLFIYARGGGTMLVAGQGTAAQALIQAAGGQLAVPGHEGFQPLTAEAVVAARPDVVLVTDKGLQTLGGPAGALALPGISATPAGQHARVIAIEDLLLLGFGPRVGEAALTLARALHPDAAGTEATR